MAESFETIIIGAGPGGLTAGRYLNDALILDKKGEIGRPVQCAEGLAKKSLERQQIEAHPDWISAVINASQIILPNGKTITISRKEGGYVLDRVAFEKFLAKKCKAEIRLQKRVVDIKKENNLWKIITDKNEIFKSKYLIGADGAFSIVRRKVFKENLEALATIEYLMRLRDGIDSSTIKIYFDKERFPLGYAWIFPKSKNTANIGVGGRGNLREKFKDFIEEIIKKELGPYEILENRSGVVPTGGANIKLAKDNALLVGDAGGLADPIFVGGIDSAMTSGRMAAELILSKETEFYESRIKSMSFASKDLLLAREIWYSFDNQVLNEIGNILESKGIVVSSLMNPLTFFNFLTKPNLRRNIFNFLKLTSIYYKNKDLLH